AFLAFLPAKSIVLEQRFKAGGQYGRTIAVPGLIDDHGRSRGLLQQRLCNLSVRVNTSEIKRADASSRDYSNIESPVLAIGGDQLESVGYAGLKEFCQTRTDNDRAGVISKIIKASVDQLMQDIGSPCVEGGLDAVKIDSRVLKSGASAYASAQNR